MHVAMLALAVLSCGTVQPMLALDDCTDAARNLLRGHGVILAGSA